MRVLAAFPLVLVLAACDKGESKPSSAPPATSAAPAVSPSVPPSAPSAVASAAPAGSAAAAAGKMAHCPSAVTGANTVIKDVEGGLVLTVTAKDAANVTDIQTRARFLAESAKNMTPDVKHTGGGEGGGSFGRCPVVMRNTTVELKSLAGGTELTVKPKEAKELDWLRREARERLAEIGAPNAKDAGQGKMAHCPSAVDGATTTVKDLKDGIEINVVAKSEDGTKAIRERAKLVVAAAKVDPKKVGHQGDGSGGGGFGRCPVVLKETKVEAKDVAGGVLFTVKPEKPADLAALKKETAERTQKFAVATTGAGAAGGAGAKAPPPAASVTK